MRTKKAATVKGAVALLFVSLISFGFGQRDRLKDPKSIAEGERLFAAGCASSSCHGAGGVGGSGPRLRGKEFQPEYLFEVISNGIVGTPMTAFKEEMSEKQIWNVVAYLLSLGKEGGGLDASAQVPALARYRRWR
jgi:mono/diheme cytochrome c family protein